MSEFDRKRKNESRLRDIGVTVNSVLPVIEADAGIKLRDAGDIKRRLIALWAVVGSAFLPESNYFREYIVRNSFQSWLSPRERAFLLGTDRTKNETVHYTWKLECLYFLLWAAGIISEINIPEAQSSVEPALALFPEDMETPTALESAICIREKSEILDWADLLYRLHWAVRDAQINRRDPVAGVNAGVVQEWHLAVNWLTRYEDEDDWDLVGTDT